MASLMDMMITLGPRRIVRMVRHELKQGMNQRDPWYNTHDQCFDEAIFVGGCGRSGTTLIREILHRHPRIACGAETAILCDDVNPNRISVEWNLPRAEISRLVAESPSVVRFAETFFRSFAEREGKVRWADKTPRNVRALPRILTNFPNAKFVHILRDGRDVACSLRNHPRHTIRNGKIVPQEVNNPIRGCARRWVTEASLGLAFKGHPRCFELRYERLVLEPEKALRELCAFIGEEYHPAMIDPAATSTGADRAGRLMNNPNADSVISPKSIGRWKKDLRQAERHIVREVAGELLLATGYAKEHDWVDEPTA